MDLAGTVIYETWVMDELIEEYNRVCATPSDIQNHLPRFRDMVLELDAQHVIELGTRTGVSTLAWLYGLASTGGRLTSVDIDPAPQIGSYEHWEFIQGDDCDPAVFSRLAPADIVFIDTSHHWRQTLRELYLYRHLVKPGGLIVCHDTELRYPEGAPRNDPPFPVKAAIMEFVADEKLDWFNYTDSWGLGVIRVP